MRGAMPGGHRCAKSASKAPMRGSSRSATGCKIVMTVVQREHGASIGGVSRLSSGSVKTLAVATPPPEKAST